MEAQATGYVCSLLYEPELPDIDGYVHEDEESTGMPACSLPFRSLSLMMTGNRNTHTEKNPVIIIDKLLKERLCGHRQVEKKVAWHEGSWLC